MQQLIDESVVPILCEQVKTVSLKDAARFGSKAIADVMLLHGATKVISSVAKGFTSTLLDCMRKGTQAVDVAATVEGVPVACAEEIASFMKTVEEVGGGAEITADVVTISSRARKALDAFKIIEYDPIIGDLSKLEKAIDKFKNIPGALENNGPLLKVLELGKKGAKPGCLRTAHGAMYEIEAALELIEEGEEIAAFGKQLRLGDKAMREFDIMTSTKLIECKNIDWSEAIKKNINDIYGQLGEQLTIAKSHNKVFEVRSKNAIPVEVKNWFIKNGIQFFEG